MDENLAPVYQHVGGSGASFVDLFLAEKAIRRSDDMKAFYVFAVGDDSLPPGAKPQHTVTFESIDGASKSLHALASG